MTDSTRSGRLAVSLATSCRVMISVVPGAPFSGWRAGYLPRLSSQHDRPRGRAGLVFDPEKPHRYWTGEGP